MLTCKAEKQQCADNRCMCPEGFTEDTEGENAICVENSFPIAIIIAIVVGIFAIVGIAVGLGVLFMMKSKKVPKSLKMTSL